MKENTVVAFQNPSDFQKDPLTEVLQAGARELLAQAVEAEVSVFLGSHAALVDAAGRRRVVRNGYLPERFIQTGIGPVSVRQPRVRDRGDGAIRFTSAILPRYLRRAKSLEDLLPWLYCQRRSKSTPLAGVKMHHLMRFSPALAVVPVVHRRDPRCFV